MRVISVLLLSVLTGGCFVGQKKVKPALPMPLQPALTKPAPVLSMPPAITPIETPIDSAPAKAEELPQVQEVKRPPVVTKRPAPRRPLKSGAAPAPAVVLPEPVLSDAPQLHEILTADKRAQYETEYRGSVARARVALSRAAPRKLTPSQREDVDRIQTFLTQAEASKKDDLGTALQLARRADLVGQDLLKTLLP